MGAALGGGLWSKDAGGDAGATVAVVESAADGTALFVAVRTDCAAAWMATYRWN